MHMVYADYICIFYMHILHAYYICTLYMHVMQPTPSSQRRGPNWGAAVYPPQGAFNKCMRGLVRSMCMISVNRFVWNSCVTWRGATRVLRALMWNKMKHGLG